MYPLVLSLFALISPLTFFVLYRHFQGTYDKEARLMKILAITTATANLLALLFLVYPGHHYLGAGAIAFVAGLAALVLAIFTLRR